MFHAPAVWEIYSYFYCGRQCAKLDMKTLHLTITTVKKRTEENDEEIVSLHLVTTTLKGKDDEEIESLLNNYWEGNDGKEIESLLT